MKVPKFLLRPHPTLRHSLRLPRQHLIKIILEIILIIIIQTT